MANASVTLMAEVAITGEKNGYESKDFSALANNSSLMKQVLFVIRGQAKIVMNEAPIQDKPTLTEIVIDQIASNPIIRVDRSICPGYPDWMKEVIYPELENTGPTEFDVSKLDLWLHDDQGDGVVTGIQIHEVLKKEDMLLLKTCLGLRDLMEIQKKGVVFFRKFFGGKAVFGWKSVVMKRGGGLRVPYLCENGDRVELSWRWREYYWHPHGPALRYVS